MRRQLSRYLPAAFGVLAMALLYGQLLVPGRVLAERDIPGLHLPLLTDLVRLVKQSVPYWNPWIHGGQPLLTNPHYAAFYPPTWIALVLPPYYAISALVVLHAGLAFVGVWRIAVRWGCGPPAASLAAIAFVGGGAFASSPNMLNLFMGLAWIPWIMLWGDEALASSERRRALLSGIKTALVLGAQFLAGSPVTPLLSLLILICLGLEMIPQRWRRILRLIPIVSTGLAIAAIQLLPTLRHISSLSRGTGLATGMATTWSTPPARLAELLWARIFGDPMLDESLLYLGYPGADRTVPLILSIHCGALILALALGGLTTPDLPYRRTLAAMIGLGIFLALGRYNPIYSAWLVHLPPFSLIRFPEKFLLLSTTGIALGAGLAWQRILSSRQQGRPQVVNRLSMVVIVIALVSGAILYFTPLIAPDLAIQLLEGATADKVEWHNEHSDSSTIPTTTLAARAGYLARETFMSELFWLATLVVLTLASKSKVSQRVLVVLALGLTTVELAYLNRNVNRTVPVDLLTEPPESLRDIPPTAGRIFSDAILFGDTEFMISDPDSEIPTSLRRFLQRLDPYSANLWGYSYALHPDFDLMLTNWGQHAVDLLTSEVGLRSRGWTDRSYRYLGAWNVGIVVRRRSPAAQMEEKSQTGAIPVPVRLQPNPHRLPKYRFLSQMVWAPDLAAAIEQVSVRDFALASFDAAIRSGRSPDPLRTEFDPHVEVLELSERGSRIEMLYRVERPAYLVMAITADRDWRAAVDGATAPIETTAIGQIGVALPEGQHRLTMRYRNPAVLWGGAITLVSILGCAITIATRRISIRG